MLFNTTILDAPNYVNQDYMRVNYTLIVIYSYAPGNRQPIKKCLMFLPGYGPMAIADWSIIVQCHLLVLGSIGAVVEMGVLSYIETTAYGD
jgi:hypothetical protein